MPHNYLQIIDPRRGHGASLLRGMITLSVLGMATPVFGAIGFSLLYLLLGGGLGGAVLIFIVAKMLGK